MGVKLRDPSLFKSQSAFIAGEWVTASRDDCFEVFDPATSRPIALVPDFGRDQCEKAIASAVYAAARLKVLTGRERGVLLRKWLQQVKEAADDIASVITSENGKPLEEARGEVIYASDFIDWFSGEAVRVDGSVHQASALNNRIVTIKQPVGVVGIVTPWNFPAAMVTRKVAAALAAGCPCVIKPAPETPLTALVLAHLAHVAGFPQGSLSVVTTRAHTIEVGKVLTQHPDIRKFSFTGSTAVGKLLASQCTTTVKRVSLELGGNSPFVVFEDADLERAADGIMASKFRLSGQTCVCANRVFVQAAIYDKLAAILADRVSAFRLGAGHEPNTNLGPLITRAAVDKVESHVKDAVERGAQILIGGKRASTIGEHFFEPTVLIEVTPEALCAREETFGPLLPLIKFETEEEAVRLANSTSVGLAGYFYTNTVSRAWRVAEAIEVGMVGVNTGLISDVASPFGGIKESGQGREGSNLGIEEYLEVKSITFRVDL